MAPLLFFLVALGGPAQEADVQQLLQRGEVGAALAQASQLTTPLARSRWRVRALHEAGWLDLALAEAMEGLAEFPEDPNLLDQAGWIAASTQSAEHAEELAMRMASIRPDVPRWAEKVARQGRDAARLSASAHATRRALLRARVFTASILVLLLAAWTRVRPL
jgi:hypothetical protein